jgi:hypothetical protein
MPHTVTTILSSKSTPDGSSIEDSISQLLSAVYASKESAQPTIPAAKAGSLTTRTDDDTGELTMASGHGITTGQVLDLFWSGGSRRGMTVGTVATNQVPIDGGSGDVLPTAATAITAMVPVEVVFTVDGDDVGQLVLYSPRPGYIVFIDDVAAEIAASVTQFTAAGGKVPFSAAGGTNPLAGEITTLAKFSHDDANNARVMKAIAYFGAE